MAHVDPASLVVLVVGDTSTPEALADLTAFAHDVADRLQFPAEIAVGMSYDVSAYEGVVLHDSRQRSERGARYGGAGGGPLRHP
jgi:hypothetical protein